MWDDWIVLMKLLTEDECPYGAQRRRKCVEEESRMMGPLVRPKTSSIFRSEDESPGYKTTEGLGQEDTKHHTNGNSSGWKTKDTCPGE